MIGGWLSGPRSVAEAAGIDVGYPGQRLGLPPQGPNSVPSLSRRIGATLIDWFLALLIAQAIAPDPSPAQQLWLAPAIFGLINLTLVSTIGAGVGGRVLRMRVARLDGSNPLPLPVALRTLLLMALIPALFNDRDFRGLHDQAAGTIVVRR